MKQMYARIVLFDKAWYHMDLPRLIQQVNHVARGKKAGLNARYLAKVKRYFDPWPYNMRQEMRGLIQDIARRP